MPVGTVLVDRARKLTNESVGVKVEGTTLHAPVASEWFRCRLTIPAAPESADQDSGRRRVEKRPNFMFALRDLSGVAVDLTVEDMVEVDSAQLGRATYMLEADPELVRKKRSLSHGEVNLRRVDDHVERTED